MSDIRNSQLPKALDELDELIEYIKEQKLTSSEEAMNAPQKKLGPIISVMFALVRARERLEDMAVVVPPILELPPDPNEG